MLWDTFWEVSELDFEDCENVEQGGKEEGTSEGTAAEARALRRDFVKALKDKEGLNRLRRERKICQRGTQCQVGYFTR